MHIVGAIVGEHTYNVDAYDRLQTYYVKAVAYLEQPTFPSAMTGEDIADFVAAAAILRLRRANRTATICGPAARACGTGSSAARRGRHGFPRRPLQRHFLPALLCRPDLRPRPAQSADGAADERPGAQVSGLPRLDGGDPSEVYETIMDPDLTLPYVAATLRKSIDAYSIDRRLRHLAKPRHHRDALQCRQSGGPRLRAEGGEREAPQRRASRTGCPKKTTMAGWSTKSCRSCRRCFEAEPAFGARRRGSPACSMIALRSHPRRACRSAPPAGWRARSPPATGPTCRSRRADATSRPAAALPRHRPR